MINIQAVLDTSGGSLGICVYAEGYFLKNRYINPQCEFGEFMAGEDRKLGAMRFPQVTRWCVYVESLE